MENAVSQPIPPYSQGEPHQGYQPPHPQFSYDAQPPYPPRPPVVATPPPPMKSRTGLWIGLGVGATVLVLLAGAGLAFAMWRVQAKPSGNNSVVTPPSLVTSPSPSKKAAPVTTLTAPDKLGTRKKITDAQHTQKVAETEAKLKSTLTPGAKIVVGYYGTADPKQDKVYLVGSTIPGPLKKSSFDKQFDAVGPSIGGQPITGVVDVSPGTVGGFIRCGQTTKDGMNVAACAWSNEYTYIVVQWYNRALTADIKKEIVTIRALVEKTS
ncbi:MAG TPA: hypothetical protein DGG94_13540 [Micromonosporaceae bacterium]|nr:hypothetical protein [Micromonosporaceae bacterium]